MAINPILASAGNLPGLDLHSRHKGVHGETKSQSAGDPATDSAPLGTNQHLFSHLMDSSQALIGISPAAAARKP